MEHDYSYFQLPIMHSYDELPVVKTEPRTVNFSTITELTGDKII